MKAMEQQTNNTDNLFQESELNRVKMKGKYVS